jgi:hypothetical protein
LTGWLLDTNVVSELRRPRPEPAVVRWTSAQPEPALHIGTVTLAEIRCGIARLDPADRFRAELLAWLESELIPWFQHRVVPVTEPVLCRWLDLVQRGRSARQPRIQPDLLLAACALENDLGVATRNTADFAWTGVRLADPWQG